MWVYAHKALKLLTTVAATLGHPLLRLVSVAARIIVELQLRVEQLTVSVVILIAFGATCIWGTNYHFALVGDEAD